MPLRCTRSPLMRQAVPRCRAPTRWCGCQRWSPRCLRPHHPERRWYARCRASGVSVDHRRGLVTVTSCEKVTFSPAGTAWSLCVSAATEPSSFKRLRLHRDLGLGSAAVLHLSLGVHRGGGVVVRKRRGGKKHPATALGPGGHSVRDAHGVGHREGDVAVEAAKVLEVGVVLAGREGRVGVGVQLHGEHVLLADGRQLIRDVIRELRVAALVDAEASRR